MSSDVYDIVIIGGGPAGMTAGIYCSRARMKALLIEKTACGGQVLISDMIENYPGFPKGIRGPELADLMLKQANEFGLSIKYAEAEKVVLGEKKGEPFAIKFKNGEKIKCLSLIISTGAKWNSLGVPGEKELTGRGVSYCATCDGPLFKGKEAMVVGGGDTAIEDALFLTRFARKVIVVHRRGALRAARILQERASKNDRIELRLNSTVSSILGDKKVEGVKVKDVNTSREEAIKTDGVFVLVGITPNSDIVKGLVKTDEKGYIITGDDMRSSVDGIFACGDVRGKALRQIVTAVGEGAAAAFSAQNYVESLKGIEYR